MVSLGANRTADRYPIAFLSATILSKPYYCFLDAAVPASVAPGTTGQPWTLLNVSRESVDVSRAPVSLDRTLSAPPPPLGPRHVSFERRGEYWETIGLSRPVRHPFPTIPAASREPHERLGHRFFRDSRITQHRNVECFSVPDGETPLPGHLSFPKKRRAHPAAPPVGGRGISRRIATADATPISSFHCRPTDPNPLVAGGLGNSRPLIGSVNIWNRNRLFAALCLSDYWIFIFEYALPSPTDHALATFAEGRVGTFSSHQTVAPNPSSTTLLPAPQGRYIRSATHEMEGSLSLGRKSRVLAWQALALTNFALG